MYHRTCAYCGKPFSNAMHTVRHCSVSCGRKSRTRNRNEQVKEYLLERIDSWKDDDQCWIWRGSLNDQGYAMAFVRNGSFRASRLAYELFVGPIPDGLNILHDPNRCNNPACINPKHLRPGTQKDNAADRAIAGTQPRGESHYKNKRTQLSEQDVIDIRTKFHKDGMKQAAIAREYGLSIVGIGDIIHRRTWGYIEDGFPPPTEDARVHITDSIVLTIRKRGDDGETYTSIAKDLGLHIATVQRIHKRMARRDVPEANGPSMSHVTPPLRRRGRPPKQPALPFSA